jgi:2-polyprenyl-3-methyl-5-hydroxy-6-metoxy-1,4-benzoquinol methylase
MSLHCNLTGLSQSGLLRLVEDGCMDRCKDVEILDEVDMPAAVVAQIYRELRMVNFWLGNTGALLALLERAADAEVAPVRRVLDIGCGQGALLVAIREKLGLEVVGMDLRPAPAEAPVRIVTGNAVTDPLPEADVTICMMMAHHLSEAELGALIGNVARSCRRFIVLDLVRHPVPLALFRVFVAPLLGRINAADGKTSIRRAYTAREMRRIVDGALAGIDRPVRRVRHTVSPLWIRQVVDISWEAV